MEKRIKKPMRGFFNPKPLQRVFDWAPYKISYPILLEVTARLMEHSKHFKVMVF